MEITLINGEVEIDITSRVSSAQLDEAVNTFAKLQLTVVPETDAWDQLLPLRSHIRVTDGQILVYMGRILTVTPKMDRDGVIVKSVVCEDRMAYLCDSVQPYTPERQYSGDQNTTGLQEFIDVLLNNHNSQVEDYKRIYRGNVTLSTWLTSDGVYKGLNYENTWDAIKSKLLDVFGGEMHIRQGVDGNGDTVLFLDYAENLGTTQTTTIEVAKNMISGEHTVDPTKVISRLIPLGAKMTVTVVDEWGNSTEQETEERLTIADLNNGVIWLENQDAVDLYGVTYGTIVWDDVTTDVALLAKGMAYLANDNTPTDSYTITAVDLQKIGIDPDSIELYQFYPVTNTMIGIDTTLEVVRKSTNLFEPHLPSITFGSRQVWLSDLVNSEADRLNAVEALTGENSTSVYNLTNSTKVYVDNSVSGLEAYADAAVEKYIRMENGEIVIGIIDNPVSLTLSNDRISFKQNGMEVAYLSNNRLFVTDGEFLTSVKIGNFQFIPRDNGNLSFTRVVS
ncbi:MAG: phage tail protein [Oscillospiraceae bacterium]|nr:phage tail protein [Oscillospiraceae bacterium]